MPRPDFPLSIVEFQRRFADEGACRAYLLASRWPEGFGCRRCGGVEVGGLQRRRVWQCKSCGLQTSVTAGTVMHGMRTPLTLWFWAAYLVATHHPGISAVQLKRQLGLRRYETAWLILQKLRRAMVAPEREPLKREVEVDEAFIGGLDPDVPGRSYGKKALVAIAIEGRGRGAGRIRLQALPDASGDSLCRFVAGTTSIGAIVHTDGFAGYNALAQFCFDHRPRSQRQARPGEQLLPRAHRAISNLKAWLHGTHRDVSRRHLQVYLDEHTFRHNRRRTPMAAFQTLLGLSALHQPTTYHQITRRAA